jgi:hypothetical protein
MQKLERIWMTCLVVCAVLYMSCMMVEMGPKALVASISGPIVMVGLIAGTALFVVGIAGAFLFTRLD